MGVAVLAGLVALPAVAREENPLRWFGSMSAGETTLAYGMPDSDYGELSFRCVAGKPDLQIRVHREPVGTRNGKALAVHMQAGDVQVALSGKGEIERNYAMLEIALHRPLDDAMRYLLTSGKPLSVTVEGKTATYAMEEARERGRMLVAACGSRTATGNLAITVTNETGLPIESLAYSEAGSDFRDSDAFGYKRLKPGARRTFTILGGRDICTFDIWVAFRQEEEGCCSDHAYAGTRNFCENSQFILHSLPVERTGE